MASANTLAHTVAESLREAIYEGKYVSGERLVEFKLAEEYSVSQNTLRDALFMLEREGLVWKYPRRGVYVRLHTREEATEIYALWATLESLALGWAIDLLKQSDINTMRGMLNEARFQLQVGNIRQAVRLKFAFHELITKLAEKPQTFRILHNLRNQVRLLENIRHQRAPRNHVEQDAQLAAYASLLETIAARDSARACQLLSEYIHNECLSLLPVIETG